MSRIRSVHPTLFTDEVFMAASAFARLLMIGLWTEADDQGVFEWKPLSLKARLLPADNVDLVGLLAELVSANVVVKFEADGKTYGAIRNFCKFQRPQKANAIYPLPEAIASYVEISARITREEREKSRSATRKSDAMEDGGGRGEKDEAPTTEPNGSFVGEVGAEAPAPPPRVSKRPKKAPFPEGWEPDDEDLANARRRGMDGQQIERSTARFRSHKIGATSVDWHLDWDSWIAEDCARDGIKPAPIGLDPDKPPSVFVLQDDPKFVPLRDRYRTEKGKDPPVYEKSGGSGWWFDPSWLPAELPRAIPNAA